MVGTLDRVRSTGFPLTDSREEAMSEIEGGCCCGAIRYRLPWVPPVETYTG